MIKKLFFLFAMLFIGSIQSQDLIITKESDTIHCKIQRVKKEHIYFMFKKDGVYQSSIIEKSKVNIFTYQQNPSFKISRDSLPGYEKSPKHLLAINFGISYDPIDAYPNLDDYQKQLSTGIRFEGNYTYYFKNSIGIGLAISYFSTNAQEDNVINTDVNGNQIVADLSNDISTFFIGPMYAVRYLSPNKRNMFIWNTAMGYLSFKDVQIFNSEIETTGKGFGGFFSLGYNYGINDKLSIGLQAGITALFSDKFSIDDGNDRIEIELPDDERFFGSAHMDFSVGLRYSIIE